MEANVTMNAVDYASALLLGQGGILSKPVLTASAVFGLFVPLVIYWATAFKSRAFRNIPGPKPSILLGNLVEVVRTGYPACHVRWIKEFGRVCKFYSCRQEFLVVAEPELVKDVLVRNFKAFYNRPVPPFANRGSLKAMVFAQGAYWASVRNSVLPLFHTEKLTNYGDIMNRNAGILVKRLEDSVGTGQPFNFLLWAEALALDVIGASAFGIEFGAQTGQHSELLNLVIQTVRGTIQLRPSVLVGMFFGSAAGFLAHDLFKRIPFSPDRAAYKTTQRLQQTASAIAARSREDPDAAKRNDLLTLLARAKGKGGQSKEFTNLELSSIVTEFILAGSDTTANTISFAVFLISTHPQVQAKLLEEIDAYRPEAVALEPEDGEEAEESATARPTFEELDKFPYLDQVVKETLRLYPTGAAIVRVASQDTEIGPLQVPAGTKILIPVYGMHHDPASFPQPELFRPERFDPESRECQERHPYAYNAFGHGPRSCIGYKFAMAEARLALIRLFQHFTFEVDLAKSGAKDGKVEIEAGVVLKPKHGIWLQAVPRNKKPA